MQFSRPEVKINNDSVNAFFNLENNLHSSIPSIENFIVEMDYSLPTHKDIFDEIRNSDGYNSIGNIYMELLKDPFRYAVEKFAVSHECIYQVVQQIIDYEHNNMSFDDEEWNFHLLNLTMQDKNPNWRFEDLVEEFKNQFSDNIINFYEKFENSNGMIAIYPNSSATQITIMERNLDHSDIKNFVIDQIAQHENIKDILVETFDNIAEKYEIDFDETVKKYNQKMKNGSMQP